MDRIVENIEEVVLAVEHQDNVVALFEDLFGFEFKDTWDMPMYNMRVKSARVGNTQFQIVASTNPAPDAFLTRFIKARGEGIHHVAFNVHDLNEIVARLQGKGVQLIPGNPIEVGGRARFIFVHPKFVHGILIELIESSRQ
jgi:methylmalonyl-CoA/ethylmalonyl-CoA epimerase